MKYLYLGLVALIGLVVYFVVKFIYEHPLFSLIVVIFCIAMLFSYLKITREEREIARRKKEKERILQKEKEKEERKLIHRMELNNEYAENEIKRLAKEVDDGYEFLKIMAEKNAFLKREKQYIEHCIVSLNIHDKDFLNDYSQLLDHIEDVKEKGKR